MRVRTQRFLPLAVALSALCLTGQQPVIKSGIDVAAIDKSCKPCDDFWRYANGTWLDQNPIPGRYSSWGTLSVMAEANRERLRVILEEAAKSSAPAERKIGNFYSSCMDTARIDALGAKPIQPFLDSIGKLSSRDDLTALLAAFGKTLPAAAAVLLNSRQDSKNSSETIAAIGSGSALSLPDRDYYLKQDDRSKKTRAEFTDHIAHTLHLLGDSDADAAAAASQVLQFETTLAESTLDNVKRRDPYLTYHKLSLAQLKQLAPALDWDASMQALGIPAATPILVSEPDYVKAVNRQVDSAPISVWKTWLRWRVLNATAASLSKDFFEEDFRFKSSVLGGITEKLPRWQTCLAGVDTGLGDALGELFVQKHFPPAAKQRMNELVENLRATLAEQIQGATWMNEQTRKNAIAKLQAFRTKIGYPDRPRDYSAVRIDSAAFFENVRAAAEANRAHQLAKIGKPLDRNDWSMTPPTVNAYYNSVKNEIAFPAGILQPPLFDRDADDAANYGSIGAVIGHEMGHGFDDQGSKYAANGNLTNWWTDEDRKQFDARASCVAEQFNSIDVGDGLRHKGGLVLGEALGDLNGLKLAYRAYKRSLIGKPEPPVIDGFTGDQRFFLAFARTWGTNMRPEAMRLRLNTDPHPLSRFRAIATLQNMPEFHRAFHCKPGDPMVRPVDKQCNVW